MKSLFKKIFFHDKWNVGIGQGNIQEIILGDKKISDIEFSWLPEIKGHYVADPFLFKHQGKNWLFYEDFLYRTNSASLAVREVMKSEEGKIIFGKRHQILDNKLHRSYPNVFRYQDEIYMIPEQATCGKVMLYQAKKFPFTWEKKKILLNNFSGVDATIFKYKNKLWMFVSELGEKENNELHLYFSDDLFGHWKAHPRNPIISSDYGARMAGKVYQGEDNQLFRMGQNCSTDYGEALVIYKIVEITDINYREEKIRELKPFKKYKQGLHTLNHLDGLITIDAKRWASLFEIALKLKVVFQEKLHQIFK